MGGLQDAAAIAKAATAPLCRAVSPVDPGSSPGPQAGRPVPALPL